MTSNETGGDHPAGDEVGAASFAHRTTVPLGSVSVGRLQVRRGLDDANITGDPKLGDLLHGAWRWRGPHVTSDGGDVTLSFPRFRRVWPGAHEITLNASIPWDIAIHGGVHHVGADLSRVRLRSLHIARGASRFSLVLGKPEGQVALDIRSADRVTIRRPATVPVQVRVASGASQVALDDQAFSALGGDAVLTTGPVLMNAYIVNLHAARRLRIDTVDALRPGG